MRAMGAYLRMIHVPFSGIKTTNSADLDRSQDVGPGERDRARLVEVTKGRLGGRTG